MASHDPDTVRHSGDEPSGQPGARVGEVIGPFTLRERIGVGGMGEVWLAEQTEPIRRKVALKLIKAGMDSAQVLARFEAERQALALMDHPCIARVYDAGTTASGRPYFAMEFVQGTPIDEYCDKRRLDTRQRLELFQQVCHGVQHAHQKAVLHRDLKPSNILVSDTDGRPMPKIIDFGVAKATSRKLTDQSMHTSFGQLIGTPEYMSPEQAELTTEDVDTRTDVYSLGVILYEMLVGCLPFDPKKLRAAGFEKILEILREEDPAKPSTRLQTEPDTATETAKRRRTQPRRLASLVRGDLDWIVLRALEKDRNRRYGSPDELAQDIQRHLDDEVVLAGPPTASYRASKFVRRHRTGVAVAAAAVLALATFALVTGQQARTIARERDRAEGEAAKFAAMNTFLTDMLTSADPWAGVGPDVTVVAALDVATDKVETSFESQPQVEASLRTVLGTTYLGLGKLEPAQEQIDRAMALRLDMGETEGHELGTLRAVEARLFQDRAEYDQAKQSASEAARIFATDPQATLSDRLGAYQHEVRNLLFLQRYEQADSVLTICEELVAGPEGRRLLATAQNFSLRADLLAGRDGNTAAAESLSRRAFEMAEGLAPDSPLVATYMNNTAQYHSQSGDYDGALADFDKALEVHARILGTDHPLYATCLENRGGVLYRLGRPAETLATLEEVRDIRERNLGPDHIDVLRTTINTGTVATLAGDDEKALRIFDRLLPKLIEARGEEHPDVLVVLRNTGVAYRNLERYDEARPVLERGLRLARGMYADDDPRVATARADLAVIFHRLGLNAEARDLLVRAFDVNLAKLGAVHPKTRNNAEWLVKVCGDLELDDDVARYEEYVGE